jgi:hypothetical protein
VEIVMLVMSPRFASIIIPAIWLLMMFAQEP